MPTAADWIAEFSRRVGAEPPTTEEFETLLALAGVAAHSSERKAAPVACWVTARAGVSPAEALAAANRLATGAGPGGAT